MTVQQELKAQAALPDDIAVTQYYPKKVRISKGQGIPGPFFLPGITLLGMDNPMDNVDNL